MKMKEKESNLNRTIAVVRLYKGNSSDEYKESGRLVQSYKLHCNVNKPRLETIQR